MINRKQQTNENLMSQDFVQLCKGGLLQSKMMAMVYALLCNQVFHGFALNSFTTLIITMLISTIDNVDAIIEPNIDAW